MFSPNLVLLTATENAPPRLANSGKHGGVCVVVTPMGEISGVSPAAIEFQFILSDGDELC